jgi:predicted transposase YbfD/YdcC
LKGAIITIDAMGCQYKIANQIVKGGGDYLFSLKGNQSELHNDVELYMKDVNFNKPNDEFKVEITYEKDHGRAEIRKHAISDNVQWLRLNYPKWQTINSVGVIESTRIIQGVTSTERRYYVSSLPADPKLFAYAARAHWGIENSLHHVLDVVLREDACRIRCGKSPENLNIIRKIALTLATFDTTPKRSTRKKMKLMAWSSDYLDSLLQSAAVNFFQNL